MAALTFVHEDRRECLPLTPAGLERARSLWDGGAVRTWFARRPDRMFWFVPQVAYYPDGPLVLTMDDYEPAVTA